MVPDRSAHHFRASVTNLAARNGPMQITGPRGMARRADAHGARGSMSMPTARRIADL
jgi:hypothetical protein